MPQETWLYIAVTHFPPASQGWHVLRKTVLLWLAESPHSSRSAHSFAVSVTLILAPSPVDRQRVSNPAHGPHLLLTSSSVTWTLHLQVRAALTTVCKKPNTTFLDANRTSPCAPRGFSSVGTATQLCPAGSQPCPAGSQPWAAVFAACSACRQLQPRHTGTAGASGRSCFPPRENCSLPVIIFQQISKD